jgi:hypothetical protein
MFPTPLAITDIVINEKHTPKTMSVDPDGENTLLVDEDGVVLAIAAYLFDSSGNRIDPLAEQKTANCERIAACWNACHGMPTSMLQGTRSVRILYEALVYARNGLSMVDGAAGTNLNHIDWVLDQFNPEKGEAGVESPFIEAITPDPETRIPS